MRRLNGLSVLRRYSCALGLACWVLLLAVPGAAENGTLAIELNKLENTEEGCRSMLVFDNRTGYELHRFRVDLILFDPKGIYKKQLLLDMAPLYADKTRVASFLLGEWRCDELGSVLVNDIPQCRNGAGESLECVSMLKVRSKSDVPLEK